MHQSSYGDGFSGLFRTYQCDGACWCGEWSHEDPNIWIQTYRPATHDGGFAKGWKGVVILQT